MQFWFARGSEVSIREQLVTQIVLGILSDDLARFHLHPNTISAGYRQLERERRARSRVLGRRWPGLEESPATSPAAR